MRKYKAVVLAAGRSRRLGFDKLTVRINGESVIRRAVLPFVSAGIGEVFVVTGDDNMRIKNELSDNDIIFIDNKDHLLGMSTSITAAIPFLKNARGVFFHLGDKPFLLDRTIRRMADVYEDGAKGIVIPVFEHRKGHPILIDMEEYGDEMKFITGDKGLREMIEKHSKDVISIKGDEGSLFDLDTAQDIEFLIRRGYTVEES